MTKRKADGGRGTIPEPVLRTAWIVGGEVKRKMLVEMGESPKNWQPLSYLWTVNPEQREAMAATAEYLLRYFRAALKNRGARSRRKQGAKP